MMAVDSSRCDWNAHTHTHTHTINDGSRGREKFSYHKKLPLPFAATQSDWNWRWRRRYRRSAPLARCRFAKPHWFFVDRASFAYRAWVIVRAREHSSVIGPRLFLWFAAL